MELKPKEGNLMLNLIVTD